MRALLPLLAVGCACPTWDGLRIVERPGAEGFADRVQLTVDEFAAWTATEGVCVETVELTTTAHGDAAGTRQGRHIQVDPTQGDFTEVTRHELCHAWDGFHDSPALDHPELFDAETVELSTYYPTEEARIAEAFADACTVGPRAAVDFGGFIEEACGGMPAPIDPVELWIADNVYPGFPQADRQAYALVDTTIGSAPVAVAEREGFVAVVLAGTRVAALSRTYDEQGIAVTLALRLLDPATGADLAALPVPAEVDPNYVGLLGTDGEDPVVWSAGDGVRAWRIDRDDGTATELLLPASLRSVVGLQGYVHGSSAWIQVYTYEASGYANFVLDLATGETSALPLPEGFVADVVEPRGNGDVLSLAQYEKAAVYDFTTGTFGPTMSATWSLYGLSPVADGRLFGVLAHAGSIVIPVLVDPADGLLAFAAGACTTANLTYAASPLPIGDQLYVANLPGTGDASAENAIFTFGM